MRLWAECDSITFDDLVPRLGNPVDVRFGLSLAYIGTRIAGGGWPCDLTALDEAGLVPVPVLGPSVVALWGELVPTPDSGAVPAWQIESRVTLRLVGRDEPNRRSVARIMEHPAPRTCQALGRLSIVGPTLSRPGATTASVRILRFRSLCLRTHDPRFGEWFDVTRYGDLGSDPDVIGLPVLIAELDLIS